VSKNLVLLRDVINVYHPKFRKSKRKQADTIKDPDHYNVTRLVEECSSAIGPYDFTDEAHADYSDTTDFKTASIRIKPCTGSATSYPGEITGVICASGNPKAGALRVAIYNPHTESLMFYFLPKSWWIDNVTLHPTSGIGKITYCYNKLSGRIAKFKGFECTSFEELALKVA
jgi:hypothetical protein